MTRFYQPTTSCCLLSWESLLEFCWKSSDKKKSKNTLADICKLLGTRETRRKSSNSEGGWRQRKTVIKQSVPAFASLCAYCALCDTISSTALTETMRTLSEICGCHMTSVVKHWKTDQSVKVNKRGEGRLLFCFFWPQMRVCPVRGQACWIPGIKSHESSDQEEELRMIVPGHPTGFLC